MSGRNFSRGTSSARVSRLGHTCFSPSFTPVSRAALASPPPAHTCAGRPLSGRRERPVFKAQSAVLALIVWAGRGYAREGGGGDVRKEDHDNIYIFSRLNIHVIVN